MVKTTQIRYFIFLKDVLVLAITCFGGPQVHLVAFIKKFVVQRRYLTEAELLELQALCQLLPGPTSTQTITALGFRLGGSKLAYLTLLVWALPATILMAFAAIAISYLNATTLLSVSRFIKPMGVAFVFYAAYTLGQKVITNPTSWVLALLAAVASYLFQSPYTTALWIILGGLATSLKFRQQTKMEKDPLVIQWGNLVLWAGVFVVAAIIGNYSGWTPALLFENFYRNGSLAFGGGHILKPLLYNEFVAFKHYLNRDEYLSGIALAEIVPGPTFAISSFIGALSLRHWGLGGQLLGALVASLGIFLPGIFLIFFVIRFWNQAKQYRGVRASLEGINAASTGLTFAAGVSLFTPMASEASDVMVAVLTFFLLISQKLPSYLIILMGLLAGIAYTYWF